MTDGDRDLALRLATVLQPLLDARPVSVNAAGLREVADRVASEFAFLGFNVERRSRRAAADILVATRAGSGSVRVGLSGHYDVEVAGEGWATAPFVVTEREGRLFARGIADNLGPLMLRLEALRELPESPPMVVVLQGEEEIGSPAAHAAYPSLGLPRVDLWLEETGYYEPDGTQRLLSRRRELLPTGVEAALIESAARHGRGVVWHDRYLNKAFGEHRCPFLAHLVGDAPYLAIGPNDPRSFIHQPNESLPISNLAASVHQFQAVLGAAIGAT